MAHVHRVYDELYNEDVGCWMVTVVVVVNGGANDPRDGHLRISV